jgi:hypothetical protein
MWESYSSIMSMKMISVSFSVARYIKQSMFGRGKDGRRKKVKLNNDSWKG